MFASPSRAYINPVVTSVRRVGQLRQFSPPILQLCLVVISSISSSRQGGEGDRFADAGVVPLSVIVD